MTAKQLGLLLVAGAALAACGARTPTEQFADAEAALGAGEAREAEIHLLNLLQRTPEHAEGRLLLGELLLNTGDSVGAEHNLREALSLGIDARDVQLPLLNSLLSQGKFAAVIEQVAAGPAFEGDIEILRRNIEGAAYRASRNFPAAEAAYRAALALDEHSNLTRNELANLYVEAGRFGEAQVLAMAVNAESPNDIPSKLVLGRVHAAAGSFEQAETWFRRAATLARGGTPAGYAAALAHVIEAQLAQGKSTEANAVADELLANNAASPRAVYLKARVEVERGELDAAERRLEEVLKGTPDYWPAHALLGRINGSQGQLGQAEIYLRTAVDNNPADPVARLRLAELYLRQGDLAAVRTLFRTVPPPLTTEALIMAAIGQSPVASAQVREEPASDRQLVEEASIYTVAGELASAIRILKDASFANTQGDPALVYVIVLAELWRGDVAVAAETLERLSALQERAAWLATLRGAVAARGGDVALAENEFAEALELDASYMPAIVGAVQTAFAKGADDEADRAIRRLLDGHPERSPAVVGLAGLAINRGNLDDARAWLNLAPASAARARLEGDIAMKEGGYAAAADAYRRSFQLHPNADVARRIYLAARAAGESQPERTLVGFASANPSDVEARYLLASIALEDGDYEIAIERYEALLARDSSHAQTLNNLAWLYGEVGEEDRALELARRARAALPRSPGVADTLGWLLVRRGDVAAGLPLLAEATHGAPANADIRYHWAYALAQGGDPEQAAGVLDDLLSSAPEFDNREAATELLGRLRRL